MRKPAKTQAPRKPTKPSKPQKVVNYNEMLSLNLYSNGNKITFEKLFDMVPKGIAFKDVELVMEGDDDCYSCCDCCGCSSSSSYVRAYYIKEIENPQYNREMKAYVKNMSRYNDKLEDFKHKLGEWEIRNADYLAELDKWNAEQTEKEITKLERQLKRLKAS